MLDYVKALNNNYGILIQALIYLMQTAVFIGGVMVAWWQLASLHNQLQGNSLQQIQANDREIRTLLFNNPSIRNSLSPTAPTISDQELKSRIFIALIITHAKHIFLQRRLGHIPDEYWDAVDRDMNESVKFELFQKVWSEVESYQPVSYQQYVSSKIKHRTDI